MANFQVKVNATELVKGIHDIQNEQLPFVMASTLTAVAQDAAAAVKTSMRQKFTIRKESMPDAAIATKPADKRAFPMQSEVRTRDRFDFLGLQEDGGEKILFGGHSHFAIPTKYLRQMAPGIIPAELRPKNLLGAVGGRYTVRRRKTGQLAMANQKLVRGFEFFIQKLSGRTYIMGRYFTDRRAYPFYLLAPAAHVEARLGMEKGVQAIAQERLVARWDEAWQKVMQRGIKV